MKVNLYLIPTVAITIAIGAVCFLIDSWRDSWVLTKAFWSIVMLALLVILAGFAFGIGMNLADLIFSGDYVSVSF
jgi:small basic protein